MQYSRSPPAKHESQTNSRFKRIKMSQNPWAHLLTRKETGLKSKYPWIHLEQCRTNKPPTNWVVGCLKVGPDGTNTPHLQQDPPEPSTCRLVHLFGRHHEVNVEQIDVLRGEALRTPATWALEVFPAALLEKLRSPGPVS